MSAVEVYKKIEQIGYDVPPGVTKLLLELETSLKSVSTAYIDAKNQRDSLIIILAGLFPEKSKHHTLLCDCQVCKAIEAWKGMLP